MISQSLLIVGAMTYVLAWFLPAFEHQDNIFGDKNVTVGRGWEAFWFALRSAGLSWSGLLNTGSALTNLILVAAFLDVYSASRAPHPVLRIALVVCALVNTNWWFRTHRLRIGYYWWTGSFFLIAAGLTMRGGVAQSWFSPDGIGQSALLVISATAVLAGIHVELKHIGVETDIADEVPPAPGESKTEDPKTPSDKTADVPPDEQPIRRGSYWLLFGGIAVALLAWFFMSWIPIPQTAGRPRPWRPRVPLPPADLSSPPVPGPQSHNSAASRQETNSTPPLLSPAGASLPSETSSLDVASLRQQARDLRRSLEPLLHDPTVRDAASSVEKSVAQGEVLLQNGTLEVAAARFKEASRKLENVRAVVTRNLEARRAAEEAAQKTALARQRFKNNQAVQYAEWPYWRGQQLERRAEAAYRSHEYRRASSFYASAREEYDNVLMAIVQALTAEERQREEQEKEQILREQNARRAKATGKISMVHLNLVSYGGGLNPELEILTDFEISGMTGVDGVVIAFLYLQQSNEYVQLIGSENFRNGVHASATYTPSEENFRFSKFRLAVPLSRFSLPNGTNHVRVFVYLRTGGGGQLERDLDAKSEDITLVQTPR